MVGSFHHGGSESQAIQLTRLLLESDRFEVHLASLSSDGSLREEVDRLGLENVGEYPLTTFYDLNTASQLNRFTNFLRSKSIDVVHTHDFYTNVFGMFGSTLVRVRGRVASRRETTGLRTNAQRWVQQIAYKCSNAIVANAESVRQHLIDEGINESKIVTIHNGLDVNRFDASPSQPRETVLVSLDLPVDQTRRFVTIVANLRHEVKDHPMFLRAARRVKTAVPDAAFVLAGEGELLEPLRTLAGELGLERDAFFVGRCTRVSELLSITDVAVLSSIAEGFSNSILEYMAAAKPVVATDVGGAREAIREGITGYLVPARNDEKLAARIIELLNDPVRARAMGDEGRRRVIKQFSSAEQLRRTESLYERLLAHSPSLALNDHSLRDGC